MLVPKCLFCKSRQYSSIIRTCSPLHRIGRSLPRLLHSCLGCSSPRRPLTTWTRLQHSRGQSPFLTIRVFARVLLPYGQASNRTHQDRDQSRDEPGPCHWFSCSSSIALPSLGSVMESWCLLPSIEQASSVCQLLLMCCSILGPTSTRQTLSRLLAVASSSSSVGLQMSISSTQVVPLIRTVGESQFLLGWQMRRRSSQIPFTSKQRLPNCCTFD